ncbi:MAG: hypothetical protein QMD43_06605 [Thermodesulfovibrio sp.]|uniref:Cas10/Cmr2 second palm domain-containing protein n=1 Tax=Thermodesulfovibrio sp. N1 TaxID=1871110 RepID=UPI00083B3F6F|nr:hypothetical protein [Thermodesulfovibrio sp. N1]MDI6714678.1 hypothetical protein [Thermodesulfovibrio sp.]ODA44127.1 hypothetical protein THER_1153 [Thermodesulfovibrio sp. N1]
MNNQVSALLLDTISIQRYIFSTNNLKENIGASQIVKEIYDSHLKEVIEELFSISDDSYYNEWEEKPEKIAILEHSSPFEIGYIGGGNALIFFKNEDMAKKFIKKWSMRLLIYCAGLIPACAVGKIDFSDFSNSLKRLFNQLAQNKSSFLPETVIRRHGITAECPNTGYSAEIWCEKLPDDKQNYISSVSNAKIDASEKADKWLQEILKKYGLDDEYTFTNQIDKLGQSKGKDSHIAIVHIDGNDVGTMIKKQKNLKNLREFSKELKKATLESFIEILLKIDKHKKDIEKEGIKLETKEGKTILPIRPIIIGGDDITFVSEGRLGIWLAKIFLEAFQEKTSSLGNLSACAGVAITKTKYPFYRGYKLSEDLTRSAKDARKLSNDNGSWIDFHIAYGGFSGELKEIRENHYKTQETTSLILRPYKITDLDELIKGVAELKKKKDGKDSYPRSKIMKLRQVLYLGENEQRLFIEELKVRGLKLPVYKDFKGNDIILNNKTPYFDMIELMEFYPEFALNGGKYEDIQN